MTKIRTESKVRIWVKQDDERCQGKKMCVKQEGHRQMWLAGKR